MLKLLPPSAIVENIRYSPFVTWFTHNNYRIRIRSTAYTARMGERREEIEKRPTTTAPQNRREHNNSAATQAAAELSTPI